MIKHFMFSILTLFFVTKIYSQKGIGINTTNPTESLHIKSNQDYILKFDDTYNYNGNYTVTAEDTNGTFAITTTDLFKPIKLIKRSGIINSITITENTFGDWTNINSNIRLEPGRWAIHLTTLIEYDNLSNIISAFGISNFDEPTIVVETSISENHTIDPPTMGLDIEGTTTTSPAYGIVRGTLISPLTKGLIKGIIYINNTGNTAKTYRLMARAKALDLNSTSRPIILSKKIKNLFNDKSEYNQIYAIPLN